MEFNLALNKEESDLGSTHFLGCPDVPSTWNDNAIFNNDEIFIGQINLKDLNHDLILNQGILYFFLATGSYPLRGIVRYTKELNNLERIDFNIDSSYQFDYDREYSLINGSNDVKLLIDNQNKKDDLVLLELNLNISKEINHLVYVININDLKNNQFDKAHLNILLED